MSARKAVSWYPGAVRVCQLRLPMPQSLRAGRELFGTGCAASDVTVRSGRFGPKRRSSRQPPTPAAPRQRPAERVFFRGGGARRDGSELSEEPGMVLEQQPNVRHAVAEHRRAIDAEPVGEAPIALCVD